MKMLLLLVTAAALLAGCQSGPAAAYQSTVASRKVGVGVDYSKDTGAVAGEVSDTVTYR